MYSYYNHELRQESSISIIAPGFQFGYGVFETLLVKAGMPCFLELHYKRLQTDSEKLGLKLNISCQDYWGQALVLVKRLEIMDGRLKIISFRDKEQTSSIMTLLPYSIERETIEKGYSLSVSSTKRNPYSTLTYIKSLNYTDNILARELAIAEGYQDALFMNTEDKICEATAANIFWVKNNCIYTPDTSCGLLEGISRNLTIELCKYMGIRMETGSYTLHELLEAEEVFVTNSLIGIMPVGRVNQNTFNVNENKLTRMIQNKYANLVGAAVQSCSELR